MRFSLIIVLICAWSLSLSSQTKVITFKVSVDKENTDASIGIRGSVPPLSWEKDLKLNDEDGDGIYELKVQFQTNRRFVKYKFSKNGELELKGNDKRTLWFKNEALIANHIFDEYNCFSEEKLKTLVYTADQIKEDLAVLKSCLAYIHPNLNKYISAEDLENNYKALEAELLLNPNITNAYKCISKFAAKIKCSHTFTNPWNQGTTVEKAIFHQADKIPLTFSRIGTQLFIDKNVSTDARLKKGLEIQSINGVSSNVIMNQLTEYISSDGENYEKKLERLTLSGAEKFALFDIFYSLAYGSQKEFLLSLKNHEDGEVFVSKVKAISKTKRSSLINTKYNNSNQTFADNWQFELLNKSTAILKINSFAVYNKDFDWKLYLNQTFTTIEDKKIQNLIIDIRENEGGDDQVAEYILKRILKQKIQTEKIESITAYKKIPEELRPHISTWEKQPYNWGFKVKKRKDNKYQLRSIYGGRKKTYKPMSNGFKGDTYLLTGPQNSSATHLMATVVKQNKLACIIGETTGGNQRGLNGGHYFFLRLPNCKVELDIPIFGINIQKVSEDTPNGGIPPDIEVKKSINDLINENDPVIVKTLELIEQTNNN